MAESGEAWTAAIVADSEVGLVVSAIELLPGVLSGLVLAAILAAICSTADSQLVVAASSAANDLYARLTRRNPGGAHTVGESRSGTGPGHRRRPARH